MSRKHQKNKPKKKLIIKFFLLIFFMVFLYLISIFLYNKLSSLNIFNINQYLINKDELIDKEDIILLSNIKLGENIFKISCKNAVENILKNPWIETVSVKRVFPDKISISYKTKNICALAKEQNKLFFLDCNGEIIDKYNTNIKKDLIVVEAKDYKLALKIIHKIIEINDNNLIYTSNISELFVEDLSYFSIKLIDRPLTIYLNYYNLAPKIKDLHKVIKDLEKRQDLVKHIDATLNNNKIVIRKN